MKFTFCSTAQTSGKVGSMWQPIDTMPEPMGNMLLVRGGWIVTAEGPQEPCLAAVVSYPRHLLDQEERLYIHGAYGAAWVDGATEWMDIPE